jgi:hypothetical protein
VGVDGVHVAPLVQQQLRDVRTPAEGGPVEGDVMLDVSEGRVGALVDEEVGDVGVAVFARPHQRRPSAVILTVDEALGGRRLSAATRTPSSCRTSPPDGERSCRPSPENHHDDLSPSLSLLQPSDRCWHRF